MWDGLNFKIVYYLYRQQNAAWLVAAKILGKILRML